MDNRRDEVLAVAALFALLTWLTVSLRCYVRGMMMKTWGLDDSYMVATLVTALSKTSRHDTDYML
jgi:hypothetical protein